MTQAINSRTGLPVQPRSINDARYVRSRLPIVAVQRARDSKSPRIVMAGPHPLLVVDRRAIPFHNITTIAEDKVDPQFTMIYLSRECGVMQRTSPDGEKTTSNMYIRVPFHLDTVLDAFISFEAYADLVYGTDYVEEEEAEEKA